MKRKKSIIFIIMIFLFLNLSRNSMLVYANNLNTLKNEKQLVKDNNIISIPDMNLKAALNMSLSKEFKNTRKDNQDITELEAKKLKVVYQWKDSNILDEKRIKDLSGIENFKNLQKIDLKFQAINDISPLKTLSNISEINLEDQKIHSKDITSEGNKAMTNNIIKGLNGELIEIKNKNNYFYNHNIVTFNNIDKSGNQLYEFKKKSTIGKTRVKFNGTVNQYVNYRSEKNKFKINDKAKKEVYIQDKNLKAALNKAINNKREANQGIYPNELEGLKGTLDLANKNISNITGLGYCTEITGLILDGNPIPYTGFGELEKLKDNLKELSCNSIPNSNINLSNEIPYSFGTLVNLKRLSLNNDSINYYYCDISRLSNLVNLEYLDLSYNCCPVAGAGMCTFMKPDNKTLLNFKNLKTLKANNCYIGKIPPLPNSLENLDLSNNTISDINPLKGLDNLKTLNLNNQSIKGSEITSIGSSAIANNIIKDLNGNLISIVNGKDYTYNSLNKTIVFTGISENVNKSYKFSQDVKVGKATTSFTGIVSIYIIYSILLPDGEVSLDKNLKAALNKAINNKREANQGIYPNELEGLKGTLDLANKNISNITGLGYCTEITGLILDGNPIPYTGFGELEKLKDNLKELSCNSIPNSNINLSNEIPYSFGTLVNLKRLSLNNDSINYYYCDISRLSNLVNLEYLDLSYNCCPVAGAGMCTFMKPDNKTLLNFKNLKTLKANNCYIGKIPPLPNSLENLDLSNNTISDINPLKGLDNLKTLNLNNQSIKGSEITSIGSSATANNIIKDLNGNLISIANGKDYTYNSLNKTIVFTGISENVNKSYKFSQNVKVGKATTSFAGIVTQYILYIEINGYISMPKEVVLNNIDNSNNIEGNIQIGISKPIGNNKINVKVLPTLILKYNDDIVNIGIYIGNKEINQLGEIGELSKENKKINLKLKGNKNKFKYKNGVKYYGKMEFIFN